ncbi:glutamate-1-semialdehyde 2,1-aminomutase [Dehalogenimonas formicexedens]|uniref:Glutamate-1-semialdehyde 2,1-aminomutase n=1 Tax=Dehalogenimonas formicexedens TaxID=1839801 RepID=A0A1P8F9J0_9CHLR|nr:glutamate-1-semialdehyde 2,1-aminomutase [Dehalogenimonas formicexedens]APV45102.1 glutamate-1-semialdehyde 2,1-aminomutase [Dehalogenimonas formicexedens]
MKSFDKSRQLFAEARQIFPGGVNSPVRAFKAVGGEPLFIERGEEAYLYDVDGNRYLDFVGSWGPMILGHAHPAVVASIVEAAKEGTSFGAPSRRETELGKAIRAAMPHLEMMRFVSSGTEAVMSALRLARAYTGREKIIKFEGGYHGHSDGLLSKSGSGLATLGIPESPGVPAAFAAETLTAAYNDLDSVEALFDRYPGQVAAVILEPVAANMGVVTPEPGFLEGLRELTRERGALLIFDEVITGFRVKRGGAVEKFGIVPDLTTMGKIIGGGLPVGAYGGRKEIMQLIAPSGPVYQAGTLSGNPLAMAAGLATLNELEKPGIYAALEDNAAALAYGISAAARKSGLSLQVNRIGSLMTVFFTSQEVTDYACAKTSDTEAFRIFHRTLLENGIYWPPSQFEAAFVSTALSHADVETTITAIEKAFAAVKEGRP